jgi:Leucine-rich repeat (LRR) protein
MYRTSLKPTLLFCITLFLIVQSFFNPLAHAQSDKCPRIYREGETLRTDPAQSYQWYKNGEPIPGATQESYTPTGRSANYAVQVEGTASSAYVYSDSPSGPLITGIAFDELMRPLRDAQISVGNQRTLSDSLGRFRLRLVQKADSVLLIAGHKSGYWPAHRRSSRIDGDWGKEIKVHLMLRGQRFGHELEAARGGTISRGAFFLTLQPNSVLDANNQPYTGVVKIALNGGRPDDPHFGWMMPGGDFMAQDAQGRERILQSYGFLSAHLQTPDGEPLKLDPTIGAQLRFVMPHTMVASAPDSMPLWHFDEAVGIWKEEGYARREGAAYIGTVRHFSSWNCDWPGPWCLLRGKTVDCKGRPVAGAPLRLGQQIITSDSAGGFSGRVPATQRFDIQAMNGNGKITVGPFEEGSENVVEGLIDGNSIFGYGVIDTSQIMIINSYGTKGSVEYSIDSGATYQASNTFVTDIDSNYVVLVRDSLDCPTKLPHVRLGAKRACQLLDSAALSQASVYYGIESALTSNETVYRLNLYGISEFPAIIIDLFPCVQSINLRNNSITKLPESFGLLSQLQEVNFGNNQLNRLPESFGNLSQLNSLSLGFNQLGNLPESFGNLTQLKALDLNANKLSSFPESLGNLRLLQSLYLEGNQLRSLPESIGNLTRLDSLYLEGNQLSSLPQSIGNLTRLEVLNLQRNWLKSLPESFGNLTQLQSLYLGTNQLTNLPQSFCNLRQLQNLTIESNQLDSLPECLVQLTQLHTLILRSNKLYYLPEFFGNLKKLRSLSLSRNNFTALETSIDSLSKLEELDLEGNYLTNLSGSFGNLTELRILNLGANRIITLPESFGNLSQLQELMVSQNQLSSLPESFGNLSQLKTLDLTRNQLSSLPESFGNLSQLKWLRLDYNQLTSLPESIANLTNLKQLILTGNPIPPAELERIRRLLPNCLVTF